MPQAPKSKKQAILDAARQLGIDNVGEPEVHQIQAQLVRQLGISVKPSAWYIVKTLREAGLPVETHNRYIEPPMEEAYAARLKGVLRFQNLPLAEDSLRSLHAALEEYQRAGDRRGMAHVRRLVLKGKQRAAAIARNPQVASGNRAVKLEIADWFRVWLESPDLFFVWLEVRKKSPEFRVLLGEAVGQEGDGASSKSNCY